MQLLTKGRNCTRANRPWHLCCHLHLDNVTGSRPKQLTQTLHHASKSLRRSLEPLCERPCGGRAAEQRDELAAPQLIGLQGSLPDSVDLWDIELATVSQRVCRKSCVEKFG